MPGTISSGLRRSASLIASASPSVESWSVTASTRTPRLAASATRSRGAYVPSDAVVWVWRSTAPGISRSILPLAGQRREVCQHRADADARATLGPERQLALGEGRAGDVEVRPRHAAGEVAHEESGHDGAAAALTRNVVEVRDIALEPFLVFIVERHPPHLLPGGRRGAQHPARQALVGRKHP